MHTTGVAMRSLGRLEVPAVGFGAMVLAPGLYGTIDEECGARALVDAVDAGSWFIDTSDGYGADAHNERLIGGTLAHRRDDYLVATKFGYRVPPGVDRHPFDVSYGTLAVNAEPQHIRGYALASLERLRTDHIDLYYPHFPDPTVPIEETVGAMAELVTEGLVGHIGLSNVSAAQLDRAAAVHPISAVQCEWSLWAPADPALLAAAARHGAGIVAWSPLGGGLLTGQLAALGDDDIRQRFPRLSRENLAVNNDRFTPFKSLAAELHLSASQLALAWLLHQDPHVVPIPGSRTKSHIAENVASASVVLPPEILDRLDELLRLHQPEGALLLTPPKQRTS